jgi:hypothetical protein
MNSRPPIKVLGVETVSDSVLSVVAPIGLAAAAPRRPVLMVDCDSDGPHYPGERSLADLAVDQPRRVDLSPGREGVALVRNGGIGWEAAVEVIELLAPGWAHIVTRVGTAPLPWPVVPVVPLLPGILMPELVAGGTGGAVWQACWRGARPPGPGPVLPPLSRSGLTALLQARWEPAGRWVKAWKAVWELPWP